MSESSAAEKPDVEQAIREWLEDPASSEPGAIFVLSPGSAQFLVDQIAAARQLIAEQGAASVPHRKERLDLIARVPPLGEEELAELWQVFEQAADEGWLIVRPLADRDPTARQFHRLLLEVERLRRLPTRSENDACAEALAALRRLVAAIETDDEQQLREALTAARKTLGDA